jgi:dihydroneopterin aldolase
LGIIELNNIRSYAFHGCLTEEGKIGSEYRIDLSVEADLQHSAKTDELKDTVDYVQLNEIVMNEMKTRSYLLEHVADRILNRVLKEIEKVQSATVKVSKINPPLGGDVEDVSVSLSKKRKTVF